MMFKRKMEAAYVVLHLMLHTAVGEALGRAVREAVTAGAADWVAENGLWADGYPEDAV
jgi:hypothetical protein